MTDQLGAPQSATPSLTPRQQELLDLFEGLTSSQQGEEIRRLFNLRNSRVPPLPETVRQSGQDECR